MDISFNTANFWWLLLSLVVTGAVVFPIIYSQRKKLEKWGNKRLR